MEYISYSISLNIPNTVFLIQGDQEDGDTNACIRDICDEAKPCLLLHAHGFLVSQIWDTTLHLSCLPNKWHDALRFWAFLRPFPSATLAMVDCSRSCSCLRRSFHSWLTSLFVIVRYFARCFLRCPRCHHFDAASVVRCRFFASCRKHFAHFAISDEILRPHRVCDLCEGFFAVETFFPSSKKKVSCKALYHGVFSNRLNIFFC